MFGNYLVSTQSMGGKRRGLIYVSDDSAGNVPFAKCFQFMQGTGFEISARVTYKGKGNLALRMNNTIGERMYPVVLNNTTYTADHYPLCIAPKTYLLLKQKDISLAGHIQELNSVLPSCLYLAEENITFTSSYDGTQITVPYIVLYLKTTEVNTITVYGVEYYDLRPYQGQSYSISLPKVVMKTTQPTPMHIECRHFYNPDFITNGLEYKELNKYVQVMVDVGIDFTPDDYNTGFGTFDTKYVSYSANDYFTLTDYITVPITFGCISFGYYDDYQAITGYGNYATPTISDAISNTHHGNGFDKSAFNNVSCTYFNINPQLSGLQYVFNDNISLVDLAISPITPLPVSPTVINPFVKMYNNP